ncbi:transposase [Natronogracilivirga saccharolytica]|uniref:IS110 family transposase n=1 Tax=Natronogracilivirga saccharolytica TaxID=2812953 RepID=A0A8J7RJU8_9BACT|nr:transposase [Natronogracilivirga saccharolytica]MBP3193060.1 IS110 family transposase [Natronogracilivirga saccharolytica]
MIKITHFQDSGKPDPSQLLLAIDVSSRTLDIYGRYVQNGNEFELSESIPNNVRSIMHLLSEYSRQAMVLGYSGLAFVLEPSGRHEQKFTHMAYKNGYSVWQVNPERMYKAGVIHHGDDGKSDPQDGKVLHMMARMGKVYLYQPLNDYWQQLRQLGWWLEDSSLAATDARVRMGELRRNLFVDYHQSRDLTWGPTGICIQELFGFDPWKITAGGDTQFINRVKAHRRGIPERCLRSIWDQAQSSCLYDPGKDMRALLNDQAEHLWKTWTHHAHRCEVLGRQMIQLVEILSEEHRIPPIIPGFTELMRVKILAETGPLERFAHWRQLVAYAGLKIRMRRSGKYIGKDRITKKGRVLLRKLLGQAAFSLTRKDRILGEYYHRKRQESMPGRKAKVACMRKLLKLLYGAAMSKQAFTTERVYRSAS